jgi:hypothetical protein
MASLVVVAEKLPRGAEAVSSVVASAEEMTMAPTARRSEWSMV